LIRQFFTTVKVVSKCALEYQNDRLKKARVGKDAFRFCAENQMREILTNQSLER